MDDPRSEVELPKPSNDDNIEAPSSSQDPDTVFAPEDEESGFVRAYN